MANVVVSVVGHISHVSEGKQRTLGQVGGVGNVCDVVTPRLADKALSWQRELKVREHLDYAKRVCAA